MVETVRLLSMMYSKAWRSCVNTDGKFTIKNTAFSESLNTAIFTVWALIGSEEAQIAKVVSQHHRCPII